MERGAADTERDVRGFALKFFSDEGNWDLVGNNTPVFFVRDPLKFPDFIHTQKRDPKTNLRSNTAMWGFWSLTPESLHQVMILMNDRRIPQNMRQQHGFGSHTYSFYNAGDKRVWVKFHMISQQGIANYTNEEAEQIVAKAREHSQRDLFEHIEKGDFPKWKMCVQIMPEEEAKTYRFNPFDLTKVWSHKDYPLIEVGLIELNRNPENYFADVEQSAFNPANAVPGIGLSPVRLLQGRLFAYGDAHRYRLGVNADMGGKTGTTNYNADGWFMGFTPSLVSGCWVGGEARDIHFDTMLHGQGASMALPIWAKYMVKVLGDKSLGYDENETFQLPEGFDPCKDSDYEDAEPASEIGLDDLFN